MDSNIIEKMVDFIKNMEFGDSNSISSILRIISNNEFSTEELFDIQEEVITKCSKQGILLDYSKYNGAIIGLSFNLDFIKKEKNNVNFYKKNESDIIWWIENHNEKGKHEFSFDKLKIYNLFRDYPFELSSEEIEIFDRENPYWAEYFKDRKNSFEDNGLEKIEEDIIYEKRKINEYIEKEENKIKNTQKKLEDIKKLFFVNNPEFFDKIKMYLNETFDYDILSNPSDNCIRIEIYDNLNKKHLFFAINKNMFLINNRCNHKLDIRGNSSEEQMKTLINKLNLITSSWKSVYQNGDEYYWGLTICNNNNCSLYVGNSISIENWSEFISVINNSIEDLMNNVIKDTLI